MRALLLFLAFTYTQTAFSLPNELESCMKQREEIRESAISECLINPEVFQKSSMRLQRFALQLEAIQCSFACDSKTDPESYCNCLAEESSKNPLPESEIKEIKEEMIKRFRREQYENLKLKMTRLADSEGVVKNLLQRIYPDKDFSSNSSKEYGLLFPGCNLNDLGHTFSNISNECSKKVETDDIGKGLSDASLVYDNLANAQVFLLSKINDGDSTLRTYIRDSLTRREDLSSYEKSRILKAQQIIEKDPSLADRKVSELNAIFHDATADAIYQFSSRAIFRKNGVMLTDEELQKAKGTFMTLPTNPILEELEIDFEHYNRKKHKNFHQGLFGLLAQSGYAQANSNSENKIASMKAFVELSKKPISALCKDIKKSVDNLCGSYENPNRIFSLSEDDKKIPACYHQALSDLPLKKRILGGKLYCDQYYHSKAVKNKFLILTSKNVESTFDNSKQLPMDCSEASRFVSRNKRSSHPKQKDPILGNALLARDSTHSTSIYQQIFGDGTSSISASGSDNTLGSLSSSLGKVTSPSLKPESSMIIPEEKSKNESWNDNQSNFSNYSPSPFIAPTAPISDGLSSNLDSKGVIAPRDEKSDQEKDALAKKESNSALEAMIASLKDEITSTRNELAEEKAKGIQRDQNRIKALETQVSSLNNQLKVAKESQASSSMMAPEKTTHGSTIESAQNKNISSSNDEPAEDDEANPTSTATSGTIKPHSNESLESSSSRGGKASSPSAQRSFVSDGVSTVYNEGRIASREAEKLTLTLSSVDSQAITKSEFDKYNGSAKKLFVVSVEKGKVIVQIFEKNGAEYRLVETTTPDKITDTAIAKEVKKEESSINRQPASEKESQREFTIKEFEERLNK